MTVFLKHGQLDFCNSSNSTYPSALWTLSSPVPPLSSSHHCCHAEDHAGGEQCPPPAQHHHHQRDDVWGLQFYQNTRFDKKCYAIIFPYLIGVVKHSFLVKLSWSWYWVPFFLQQFSETSFHMFGRFFACPYISKQSSEGFCCSNLISLITLAQPSLSASENYLQLKFSCKSTEVDD